MQNYTEGQLVRLSHTFYDGEGSLVDPTLVRFSIEREADGVKEYFDYEEESSSDSSISTGEVVRVSEGRYIVDVDTSDQSGVYSWRVRSEGPIDAAQGQFYVEPANLDDESSDDPSSSSSSV